MMKSPSRGTGVTHGTFSQLNAHGSHGSAGQPIGSAYGAPVTPGPPYTGTGGMTNCGGTKPGAVGWVSTAWGAAAVGAGSWATGGGRLGVPGPVAAGGWATT